MNMAISINNLIYPYFVSDSRIKKKGVESFPGINRFSIDSLIKDLKETQELGLNKILLFGVPNQKDDSGVTAYQKDNIVALATKKIKAAFPNLVVFTDVCLCAYTKHGHCGIIKQRAKGKGQKLRLTQKRRYRLWRKLH